MDALFLSCKSSVSGSILSLSLTDDARCDPFSSRVSMLAATPVSELYCCTQDLFLCWHQLRVQFSMMVTDTGRRPAGTMGKSLSL